MATATPSKPVAKRATRRRSPGDFVAKLRQFLVLKQEADAISDRVGKIKKELSLDVERSGYEDDKGHIWFDLPEDVTVTDEDGKAITYTRVKREKRVGYRLDAAAAEKVLKKHHLFKDAEEGGCLRTIQVLDEEEIRKAQFKGRLSDEEIDTIFPQSVTWAFLPQKGK